MTDTTDRRARAGMRLGAFYQTEREKRGMMSAINLFFGALLGANLGTVGDVSSRDYVSLVILLGGAVSAIYFALVSERRMYALATLAFYAAVIGLVIKMPNRLFASLAPAEFERIALTLLIWLGFAAITELMPTRPSAGALPAVED